MNNFENDIFEFSSDNNEEIEQNSNNFNYDAISGLGESNYENEDLFKSDVDNSLEPSINSEYNNEIKFNENGYAMSNNLQGDNYVQFMNENSNNDYNENVQPLEFYDTEVFDDDTESAGGSNVTLNSVVEEDDYLLNNENSLPVESNDINNEVIEETPVVNEEPEVEIPTIEQQEYVQPEENKIEISDTPIEELNKLTEYKDEKIESTDINALFDKVGSNVKEASDIFRKNTEMKEKIDSRFNELKRLQSEIESAKKTQKEEIDKYKEEVLNKLTEKKEEIEKRLNTLKEIQSSLEKEKIEFEAYKKQEKEKIDRVQRDVQSAYDERREELNHIEDSLRKQKDVLDEERNQLSLDKIQYESDKNDLANNLLKFNELVNSFTSDINGI